MENYEFPQVDEVLDVDTEEPELEQEEKKHPLQGLADFMQECLEQQDSKGFSDTYKKAGDFILHGIAAELEDDKLTFTPEDVEYGDGYFIFAMQSTTASFPFGPR